MWEARPGLAVVCINDEGFSPNFWRGEKTPIADGRVYIIRDVEVLPLPMGGEGVVIRLVEIVNEIMDYDPPVGLSECAFDSRRFKPCQKTDISEIRKLLNTEKMDQDLKREFEKELEDIKELEVVR